MRRFAVVGVALLLGVLGLAPESFASNARVAALQVALRAHGFDPGPVDGVRGPATSGALLRFQRAKGLVPDGKVGPVTRRAFGVRGRPLLGRRDLAVGAVGWDVAVLEFRLRRNGLGARAVDGRFTQKTARALQRYQRRNGLAADGIAGHNTYRALSSRVPVRIHTVLPGESFFSIAARYHVSPWRLARRNRLSLMRVIVPGQRLALPASARRLPPAARPASRDAVRHALDYWSGVYGVDPQLVRALAWMESGFQNHVVSSVGARGVMQLLPVTTDFVQSVLLGQTVDSTTVDGNVRLGVRLLAHLLREWNGDTRLALAAWYQGSQAVRDHGVYAVSEAFVANVRALRGRV